MPRPVTIKPADIARWNQTFQDFQKTKNFSSLEIALGTPGFLRQLTQDLERSWYPGEWLNEQLAKAGCPVGQAAEIVLGVAQENAWAKDPWIAPQAALERYLRGKGKSHATTRKYH